MILRSIATVAAVVAVIGLGATAADAHHKPGHPVPPGHAGGKGGKACFPGGPSGHFTLHEIEAGATCTDPITEPEGTDVAVHGGPKKCGFVAVEDLVVIELAENVVQVCYADETPREADATVRVSFESEEEPVEEPAAE